MWTGGELCLKESFAVDSHCGMSLKHGLPHMQWFFSPKRNCFCNFSLICSLYLWPFRFAVATVPVRMYTCVYICVSIGCPLIYTCPTGMLWPAESRFFKDYEFETSLLSGCNWIRGNLENSDHQIRIDIADHSCTLDTRTRSCRWPTCHNLPVAFRSIANYTFKTQ